MRTITYFGNKKGVLDNFFMVLSLFALMFLIVIVYMVYSQFNTAVQATAVITPEAKLASSTVQSKFLGSMDTLFLFFWLGTFLGALISAWFIDSHPAFFFLSVVLLIVVLVLLIPISNFIESIMGSTMVAGTTAQFPIILFFVEHLFTIVVIQAFIILITLYAKNRSTAI